MEDNDYIKYDEDILNSKEYSWELDPETADRRSWRHWEEYYINRIGDTVIFSTNDDGRICQIKFFIIGSDVMPGRFLIRSNSLLYSVKKELIFCTRTILSEKKVKVFNE